MTFPFDFLSLFPLSPFLDSIKTYHKSLKDTKRKDATAAARRKRLEASAALSRKKTVRIYFENLFLKT